VSGIEQIDRIIDYSNKVRRVEVSGQIHAAYLTENPERTAAKIKELNELRDQISADGIDKSYKENFFQSIDNSLNYFKSNKRNDYVPNSLLLIGLGVFLGAVGMNAFDGMMKGFGETLSQTFERKVYEKMEGVLSG
jgi:hypothetical protein